MPRSSYELFYWPGIPGRGEFVRLALEDAGAAYTDVVRVSGIAAMTRIMNARGGGLAPFAPPFLRHGRLVVAQTANVLAYLAPRLGLVGASEAARLHAHQLQLTIADFLVEIHDTHHPIGSGLYYEEQKPEALRRAANFREERLPKFLRYFERVLEDNGGKHMTGRATSYVDLSMFQMVAGLRYAFPVAMVNLARRVGRLAALHDRVAERPRIAAYLASGRRLAFNEYGIFRHYPELDATSRTRSS